MLLNMEILVGGVFFFWLVVLTIWLVGVKRKREGGSKGEGSGERGWGERMEILEKEQKKIGGLVAEQIEKMRGLLKEPGVVRYNPFPEMGGDQSFSMTLIDGKGDGVVMTGLHAAREGTRVYVKPLRGGVSDYKLSKEEEKSLRKALE